jgi:hypothetical protein
LTKAIVLLQIAPDGATQVEKRSTTAKKIDIPEKINAL